MNVIFNSLFLDRMQDIHVAYELPSMHLSLVVTYACVTIHYLFQSIHLYMHYHIHHLLQCIPSYIYIHSILRTRFLQQLS